MGIDLNADKIVTYNPAHQRRVITDPLRKPPLLQLDELTVASVFGRRKVGQDNLDGNPLIYALKGKFGYSMPYGSYRHLIRCGIEIAPTALQGIDYEMVVPLPSSSELTAIIAKRIARMNGNCPTIRCLDKATIGQVLEKIPEIVNVERRYRNDFGSQLHALQAADANEIFEMKHVAFPLRRYFVPVVANQTAAGIAGANILLVDDILGSGTSMVTAARILEQFGAKSVKGFTLMGRLG